jgi:hypothetical protein
LPTRSITGAASSGSSPWKVAKLARGAAADRLRRAVDRTLVLGHRGDLPERRPSVAEQLGTDRLHGFTLLAGSSNQFITLGTSAAPIAAYRITLNVPSSAGGKPSDTSPAFAAILRAKSRSLLT